MKMKKIKAYRVKQGARIDLARLDAGDTAAFRGGKGGKDDTAELFGRLNDRLEELQEMLWAENRHKLLVVLQGLDTSGKDGTIRHVFDGVNPLGVRVASFKAPTPEELAHDFLWRVHPVVPGKGEMVIWVTNDDRKMPVKIQSDLPLGKVNAVLTKFKEGKKDP